MGLIKPSSVPTGGGAAAFDLFVRRALDQGRHLRPPVVGHGDGVHAVLAHGDARDASGAITAGRKGHSGAMSERASAGTERAEPEVLDKKGEML